MAYPKDLGLTSETAVEKRWPAWLGASSFPTLGGACLPSAAIIWAHVENFIHNEQIYYFAPPTVSRAIVDPAIGNPFAVVMIIGAILLLIAVAQIARAFIRVLRNCGHSDWRDWLLLAVVMAVEVPAILGMVILSQYTGDALAREHDAGSYMLFFGHTLAIIGAGVLIRRLLRRPGIAADQRLSLLSGHPGHALFVAIASAAFGVIYFGNKLWPDVSPFWEHLALALIEMIVLVAFLSFLGRFWRFVRAV